MLKLKKLTETLYRAPSNFEPLFFGAVTVVASLLLLVSVPSDEERSARVVVSVAEKLADLSAYPYLNCYVSLSGNWLIFDRYTIVWDANFFSANLVEGTLIEGHKARLSMDTAICYKSVSTAVN